jgi:hypothetical protein
VSGWGQQLDDLAAAVTELLVTGALHPHPLADAPAALAARDAVVVELRTLIGAVADVRHLTEVRDLTMYDVVHRPAQALHRALSELPRVVPFGTVQLPTPGEASLPGYERAWQRAARATVGLERYIDGLTRLPDQQAWNVLRDLTDLAAAVPYLDHDLAEALRPRLERDPALAGSYELLTQQGHHLLRVVARDVSARVPATAPPSNASRDKADMADMKEPPALPVHLNGRDRRTTSAAPVRAVQARAGTAWPDTAPRQTRGPLAAGALSEAMTRHVHAVSARGAHLSVPDMRAVTRLLEEGSAHAARVLNRASPILAGAHEAARGMDSIGVQARQLRDAPVKSMTTAHLDLLRESTELRGHLKALAAHADHLPGGAAEHDLRRLASPALEFAEQLPALATALDQSVREAFANGLLLVPGTTGEYRTRMIGWVTRGMDPRWDEPPAVLVASERLSSAAREIAPAVREAGQDLARHARTMPDAAGQALIAARRHVGAARAELRVALTDRSIQHPAVLVAGLSSHPRTPSSARGTTRRR